MLGLPGCVPCRAGQLGGSAAIRDPAGAGIHAVHCAQCALHKLTGGVFAGLLGKFVY